MSYIGASPVVGNFQVCDAISVVNNQAAYTMQVGGANVLPESANHMLVSLNGILQKPNGSFTISGSTITFSSNLVTGDVIDFIQLLGDVLDIGTPSDATVTNAKTSFVSTSSAAGLQIKGDGTTDGTLQLNCSQNSHGIKLASPAHSSQQSYTIKFPTGNITADKFLKVASVSGSGTSGIGQLSFADAGGGSLDLLSTVTISNNASISFNSSLITDTYKTYKAIVESVKVANDGAYLFWQLSSDNGSSYLTSGYSRALYYVDNVSSDGNAHGNENKVGFYLNGSDGIGNATREALNSEATFFGLRSSTTNKSTFYTSLFNKPNGYVQAELGGLNYSSATVMNNLKLLTDSGNILSGIVKFYGVK